MANRERNVDARPPVGASHVGPRLSRRTMLGVMAATAAAPIVMGASRPMTSGQGRRADQEADRGTIRLGAYEAGVLLTWNPWAGFGQDYFWNWYTQRLLTIAPDGSILYDLAASHDVSEDGTEYTFHLVPEAKWHDGTPVTAADVAFTFNTTLKSSAGSNQVDLARPILGSQAVIDDNSKDAEGIVVVDDHTIKFVLEQPNAQVLATTFPAIRIAPRHPFEGVALEAYAEQPVNTGLPIGSGPYRMTEFRDKEFIRLEAFDGFASGTWTGRPNADAVTILIYPDPNAQLLSNEAQEVDFSYYRTPSGDQLARLRAIEGYDALASHVGYNIFYSTNLKGPTAPALLDKRVRQAMLWALDRDLLVVDVLGGVFGIPEYTNQWSAAWANPDDLVRYHPQDVELAQQLLADAGWDPSAVLDVRHNPPRLSDDIPVILSMWEALGIKAKLTPTPDDSFVADFYEGTPEKGPNYDIFFTYGFGTLDGSPWGSDRILGSDHVYPNGNNSMRFASEQWDQEFAAALLETTQEGQAEHLKVCAHIFNEELPYAPIYQRVDYASSSKRLKGPESVSISHPSAGGQPFWEWTISEQA